MTCLFEAMSSAREADDENQLDIRSENITDKEIAAAIRLGFGVIYNGIFEVKLI